MINISNLKFEYRAKEKLLDGLNLTIEPGQIVGLLGLNGVGKSTLMKMICGFNFAQEGTISVFGLSPKKRLPSMLQDLYYLPEETTALTKSIKWMMDNLGAFYPKFDRDQMKKMLKQFDLDEKSKLLALSLGQRKKAQIAFALATNVSLLLLDEPTNGLDVPAKKLFRQMISSSMNDERTIVISTHQIRDLDTMLDQVIILNNGKCIFNKSIEVISNSYQFVKGSNASFTENKLYSEESLGTSLFILPSDGVTQNKPDLEILLNAVISNPKNFN